MAIYTPHMLLQFGGTFGTPSAAKEQWSCGLRVGYFYQTSPGEIPTTATAQAYLNDTIVPALTEWFNATGTGASGRTYLDWAKFNAIDAAGHYVNELTAAVYDIGQAGGVDLLPRMPSQVSCVLTLETGFTRGRAARGRIYVPSTELQLDGNWVINSGFIAPFLAEAVDLINAINSEGGVNEFGYTVGVYSSVDGSSRPVTGVSADTVLDTQRRRTHSLEGERTIVAI